MEFRTRDDAVKAVSKWLEEEYGQSITGNADVESITYCTYNNGCFVEEQWLVNFKDLSIVLYLTSAGVQEEAIIYDFSDYDELIDFIEGHTSDELIVEADEYIEEHIERFVEV